MSPQTQPPSDALQRPVVSVPSDWIADRPYIYVNMASSFDGKITTAKRESFLLGDKNDHRRMDELRSYADAILNGVGTIRADDPPVRVGDDDLVNERLDRGQTKQPLTILVSNSGNFPDDAQIYRTGETLLVAPESQQAKLAAFEDRQAIETLAIGRETVDITGLLHILKSRSINLLLAEGGGELNGALSELDVIDEFFLTVTPKLVGGREAPTPVQGDGLDKDNIRRFQLASHEVVNDQLFLRYRRQRHG